MFDYWVAKRWVAKRFVAKRSLALPKWVLLVGLTITISSGTIASVTIASEQVLTRGPYLQSATTNSIVIVWRTSSPSAPSVRIGDSFAALNRLVVGSSIKLRVSADVNAPKYIARLYQEPEAETAKRNPDDEDPSTAPSTYQYEARIKGLKPATRYYYSVHAGKQLLAGGDKNHYFETLPPQGSDADLRIWVVGDSGNGEQDQKDVYLAMQEFTQETKRDLNLYLHVGDMAYGYGADAQFQRNFFDIYQDTLRNKVCWPAMGNHEGKTSRGLFGTGPYYDAYVIPTAAEAGGLPSGTEAYYSFDIADVHFVCLDSHDLDRSPNGAMAQWLIADLEETQQEWLIAFWHHPPYTKGSHDSDAEQQLIEMRTHFMPILESYGVDIVLSGHSHIYERSMLVDGAYATPTVAEGVVVDDGDGNPNGDGAYQKSDGLNPHEGTIAIVTGHGGAGLTRRGTMPIMREIIVEHGSVILDIRGDTLTGTMVNKNNVERDVFRIVKRGKVEVTHLEKPWQPSSDPSRLTVFILSWQDEAVGQAPQNWSLVQGEELSVEQATGDEKKQLAVKAGDAPVIATYDNFDDLMSQLHTEISLTSDETASAGIVFAFQDDQNYYVYRFDAKTATAELVRFDDGESEVLDSREVEVDFGKKVKVEIETRDERIEFQLNNQIEYQVHLEHPLPDGKFGIWVGENSAASYPYLAIRRGQR